MNKDCNICEPCLSFLHEVIFLKFVVSIFSHFLCIFPFFVHLKAHANGGNIVGQQHATLLGPTCCVRLHGTTTMLALVAYSLRPVATTLLANNTQHFWANMLRPFPWNHNNVSTCWHLLRIV